MTTENAIIEPPQAMRQVSTWLTPQSFEAAEKIAALMAKCGTLPAHLKNPADCFRVVVQAAKWQMDPFAVGECTAMVNGRLSYEGKLVHAVLMSMGAIKGNLDFKYDGPERTDQRSVVVSGTLPSGEIKTVTGTVADWKTTRNGTPWVPGAYDRQLSYRGAREWARMWAPQAVLGVVTKDEADDSKIVDVSATATVHDEPAQAKVREVKKDSQPQAEEPVQKDDQQNGGAGSSVGETEKFNYLESAKELNEQFISMQMINDRCGKLISHADHGKYLLKLVKDLNAQYEIKSVTELDKVPAAKRKEYLIALESRVEEYCKQYNNGVLL